MTDGNTFNDGIDKAVRYIENKITEYCSEYGSYDHSTGVVELTGEHETYVEALDDLVEEIRALKRK